MSTFWVRVAVDGDMVYEGLLGTRPGPFTLTAYVSASDALATDDERSRRFALEDAEHSFVYKDSLRSLPAPPSAQAGGEPMIVLVLSPPAPAPGILVGIRAGERLQLIIDDDPKTAANEGASGGGNNP
jgi:hypothetical protein